MSKRGMEMQGVGERGDGDGSADAGDRPMKATAAQLAKRNIAPLKRRPGSNRSSRQPSPAVPQNFTQSQSFQPPPAANFSFSFGNNENTPTFGAQPQQNGSPAVSFSFAGTPQPDTNTQQNGENMFGSSSSSMFGSGFGSQQQANGFNPSSSSAFGQNSTAATPAGQFPFGQNQPPTQMNGTSASFGGFGQQNGTPSNGFTFGASTEKPKESTPSFSFASNASEAPQSNASTFSFGASKPQATPTQPAPSLTSFGQPTPKENDKPSTGLFGATPPPSQAAPASGESIFSNFSKPNGVKPGMFTQSQQAGEQASTKASTPFNFTPQTEKKGDQPKPSGFNFSQTSSFANTETPSNTETPKPATNLFNFVQSTTPTSTTPSDQTPKASVFGGFGQSQTETPFKLTQSKSNDQAPKQSTFFGAQPAAATPSLKFGASQAEDTSMTTPEHTPKRPAQPRTTSGGSQALQAANPSQSAGKTLFDRITPSEPPATEPKPRLGGSLFNLNSSNDETPRASSKSHFDRMEAPATAPKPSTSLFSGASSKAPGADPQVSTISSTSKPAVHGAPSAVKQQVFSRPSMQSSTRTPTAKDWVKLGSLNQSLLAHLQTQDTDVDWSPIFTYYMQQAAKLMGKEAFKGASPGIGAETAVAESSTPMFTQSAMVTSSEVGDQSDVATPKAQAASHLFAKSAEPPATAPISKRRLVEDEYTHQPPATEKRMRPNEPLQYPKLPDSASKTAKLFASTLERPMDQSKPVIGFNPSTNSFLSAKKSTVEAQKTSEASQPSTIFKPTGFQPTGVSSSGSSGGFFASFGKQAAASQAKEQEKRKLEDYDSEEEDEASWEAKDKAKQEENRRRIEEAAKSASGFVFKPTAEVSSTNSLSIDGASDDVSSDKTQAEKKLGSGDNTWKPETPIKFGASTTAAASASSTAAAPSNPFGGLFGSSIKTPAPSNTDSTKLAPPTIGFNFGALKDSSVDTSRATTPGFTTDGETSNAGEGEPSDEQTDQQTEDMTALLPEETTGHEVLFETRMARAVKLDQKKVQREQPDGTTREIMEAGWVEKGRGPLYVLKEKSTGKTRVLLKVPPLGRPAMNFPLIGVEYKLSAGKAKVVQGTFIDHTGSSEEKAGKPSTWTIQVREASEANELLNIFNRNRPR